MGKEELIEYLDLLLKGKADRERELEIEQWLGESEENRQVYREACELYYRLNYAELWDKVDAVKALKDTRLTLRRRAERTRWRYRLAGIAAAVLICFGVVQLIQVRQPEAPQPLAAVVEDVESGEMKAVLTLANGEKVQLNTENKDGVDLGFARAVEDSLSGLVYRFKDSVMAPREFHTLSVPRAGEYIMVLSDGSRVWLNSETELRFPVTFDDEKREVFLTGEAYFEVVKDARRPFIVSTPQTKTTVLGTSFNVMAYVGENRTEITLVNGAVAVTAGDRNCRIAPGQQVAVNNESLEMVNRTVNVPAFTSWKDGIFEFDDMSLSDLSVKLSRWYDVDFFFVNREAAMKSFTGAIKRNRNLQFMLDFIRKTSGVRFEMKGKTVTVYNN